MEEIPFCISTIFLYWNFVEVQRGDKWEGLKRARHNSVRVAIDLFKEKALRRYRLTEEETRVDVAMLMENLHYI